MTAEINELIASTSIRAYNMGYDKGKKEERERIIELLKSEAVIIHTLRAEALIKDQKEPNA